MMVIQPDYLVLPVYMGECNYCRVVRDSCVPWEWEIWQVKTEQITCWKQICRIFRV